MLWIIAFAACIAWLCCISRNIDLLWKDVDEHNEMIDKLIIKLKADGTLTKEYASRMLKYDNAI